jgi:Spy/CpxP family protein refolding chaperone
MRRLRRTALILVAAAAVVIYTPVVLSALPDSADSAYDQWVNQTETGQSADELLSKLDERYGTRPGHQVRTALATAKHLTPEQKAGGGLRVE